MKYFKLLLIGFFIVNQFCSAQTSSKIIVAYDEMVSLMNKHYFDATYSGVNWPELTKETRQKIIAAETQEDKYEHIQNLLKNLKHSHLAFNPPFAQEKEIEIPTGYPKNMDFQFDSVNGNWVVTAVNEDSPAEEAGLRPGMVIKKLNKWPTAELYKKHGAMAYYYLRNTLHFYPKSKIKLTIDFKGEEQVISYKLNAFSGKYEQLGHIMDPSEFREKTLDENIGYIHFSIYLVNPVRKAIKAIKKMRDQGVDGIILDLRNNPGGMAMLSTAIAKEFCTENYSLGTQKGRETTLKFPVFAQPKPFKGKLVILSNKYSASTSEVMAAGMQTNKSTVVVGEVSAGMALPSVLVSLPDESVFQYPVADFKTVDNKTLEGIGVIPDVEVSHTLESLEAGRDLYIETAIKIIKEGK
ncbi:MAG: S41 family peptidase [Lentisphaeraceae bacterium]|nr:S41 family peptidase [Lentisphaeraceae bacterium]